MRKIYTMCLSAIFMFSVVSLMGQSPRMTVVEEATQASCPPCATANPPLQALLNANKEKAIFVGYQVWWPGVDAMFDDNPSEVRARIGADYYAITGAPNIVTQGNSGGTATTALTQAGIDARFAETSEFDMGISATVVDGVLEVQGNITASAAVNGNLKLRLIVTEDVIVNADLAYLGTNGETEFHHVFKAFVGGPQGITLEGTWAAGDTYTINESLDLGAFNIYHYDGLEIVALVQDDNTKYIHQATKSDEVGVNLTQDLNIRPLAVALPDEICTGSQTMAPSVRVQNIGNETLTACDVTYSVNGGASQTTTWTGSLGSLESVFVSLDEIGFETQASNSIDFSTSAPNGGVDGDASNDTGSGSFAEASTTEGTLTVEILTDNYGDETYWEVRNSAGVVMSGGNPNVGLDNIGTGLFPAPASTESYANNQLVMVEVPIDVNDCYTFHITDYYGDGLVLSNPIGYFKISDQDGNEILNSTAGFIEDATDVNGQMSTSVDDVDALTALNIYPNPATTNVIVDYSLENSSTVRFELFNILGERVLTQNEASFGGSNRVELNVANLETGMYTLNMTIEDQMTSSKITIIK